MPKVVICTAKTQNQAQTVIQRLEHAGIASNDISLVMADHSSRYGQAPNSAPLLGLLSSTGKLVMPGSGFFLVAGPILTTIHSSPRTTLDGVAGALIHFGVPEYEASRLQDLVKSGAILISFHTPDHDEAQRIREILDDTDVEDIFIVGEEDLSDTRLYMRSLGHD